MHARPLSYDSVVKHMKLLLERAGLDPDDYGGHSARRGGFVDRPHVPLALAYVQGHWSPESATAQQEYGHQSLFHRLAYY